MTWYLWVWGAVTTLAMGVWVFVGFAAGAEEWEKYLKARSTRKYDQFSTRYLEEEVKRLKRALAETQKGHNEYGRISP